MGNSTPLKVGDQVVIVGNHPWSGSTGEVVAIQEVMGKPRPRVRLHANGHEVFIMKDGEARVLE
jgi:hypothetical protein